MMDIVEEEEERLKFLVSGSYNALPSSYLKLRGYLKKTAACAICNCNFNKLFQHSLFNSLKISKSSFIRVIDENSYSSILASIHGLKLPKCFIKTDLTCKQCFLPWSGDSYSIKLLPVKKRKKNSSKTRVGSNKASSKSRFRKNLLILKCKICSSVSHFYLLKTPRTGKVVSENENKVEVKKKKKKRKKDKTCGLHIPLQTSLKKNESSKKNLSKTVNSASKLNEAASPTVNTNRNVQQINLRVKNSRSVHQLAAKKIQQHIKSKSLCNNSHAAKIQCKTSKKKNKNLQRLKEMVQEQKEAVKRTLKDFLTKRIPIQKIISNHSIYSPKMRI